MNSSTEDARPLFAVTTRHVVAPELDEDVWDRVTMLARDGVVWQGPGSALGGAALVQSLRAALQAGTRELLLVSDGPRLLGFAALRPPLRGCTPHLEEIAVRSSAPAGAAMTVLLEAALAVERRRCDAEASADQQVAA